MDVVRWALFEKVRWVNPKLTLGADVASGVLAEF